MLGKFKALQQAAALPYVWTPDGLEIALVTSRERKRVIVPKGWPEKKRSLSEVAAREALEEAGLEGKVSTEPVGSFAYKKMVDKGYEVTCRVFVFPLLVTFQRQRWKEQRQRRRFWLPIGQAAKAVDDAGLAKLLTQIATKPEKLHALSDHDSRVPAS